LRPARRDDPADWVAIEYRLARGQNDRLSDLATDLVRLPATVIAAGGLPALLAARAATERLGKCFRFAMISLNPTELCECVERVSKVEAQIDSKLQCVGGLGEMGQRQQCLFEIRERLLAGVRAA
jgi:hypothetical protein